MWQVILLFLGLGSAILSAQELIPHTVTDPTLSLRCQMLIEKRNQKLQAKRRAQALLRRSQTLQEMAPQIKQSIRQRLEINSKKLEKGLSTLESRAQKITEDIVRKGCPGLSL